MRLRHELGDRDPRLQEAGVGVLQGVGEDAGQELARGQALVHQLVRPLGFPARIGGSAQGVLVNEVHVVGRAEAGAALAVALAVDVHLGC